MRFDLTLQTCFVAAFHKV